MSNANESPTGRIRVSMFGSDYVKWMCEATKYHDGTNHSDAPTALFGWSLKCYWHHAEPWIKPSGEHNTWGGAEEGWGVPA